MKKINLRALLFGFGFASLGVALAVTVTIPNTFASGEVVSSSKINANFAAVKTGFDNHNHFGELFSGSISGNTFGSKAALSLNNTASGGSGLWARSVSPQAGAQNFAAVTGENINSSLTDFSVGVVGSTGSGLGAGVAGYAGANNGTAAGVFGYSYSTSAGAAGVRAEYAGSGVGTALELKNGAVRVTGAVRPAFIHTATGGSYISCIDNPMTNNDPNAIVTFSHVWTSTYYANPFAVYYEGGKWCIFSEVTSQVITAGTKFSVIVFKQ
jgi:hypothetical protein